MPTQPGIEKPAGEASASRLYELRSYRSPSEPAGRRKIEMFEAGGELAIFRRLGFHVVFFGRDLVGSGLPCLSYMLAWADPAARERGWLAFRDDPAWLKLRDLPQNADIVSGIDASHAARDRLLAGLILIKGGLRRPALDPRSLRPSESGYVRSSLQTRPPGNSWAASEAGFISIE